MKTGREVRQGRCLSLILFNLGSEYLTKAAVERFGVLRIGGQVICIVKYADDFLLLAKEKMILQSMIDRLVEVRRRH